jgi:cellulose synthase/poly-beta-1,6-N-acetylglucosamine synthase-like glycosyltransferase
MQTRVKLSLGIPAYNEAANIKTLLQGILSQKGDNFDLVQVIVVSDGSTDATASEVISVGDSRVELIDDGERKGQAARQNQVIERFSGDLLVLVNADVLPENDSVLARMVARFQADPELGLAAGRLKPVEATGFFEKTINYSVKLKDYMVMNNGGGNNILACKGAYRAFSKKFLENFHFPQIVNEDAYTYLYCITNGFHFEYVRDSAMLYKSPANFRDHKRQSLRFSQGQEGLKKYFDAALVERSHRVPLGLFLKTVILYFLKNPILFISYMLVNFRVKMSREEQAKLTWEVAESTKKVAS